jgi:hypothetical protein
MKPGLSTEKNNRLFIGAFFGDLWPQAGNDHQI